ncbi:zinc-ribbon domain-containing protein [Saliphagus sp. GCM10025334]
MEYCRTCDEEITDAANYCPHCGTSLNDKLDSEEGLDKFWNAVDGLVDSQVDGLKDWDLTVPAYMEDEYVLGLRMYVMGNAKGTIRTLILLAADDWDDVDPDDLDLSFVYDRIIQRIDERETDIKAAVNVEEPDF